VTLFATFEALYFYGPANLAGLLSALSANSERIIT